MGKRHRQRGPVCYQVTLDNIRGKPLTFLLTLTPLGGSKTAIDIGYPRDATQADIAMIKGIVLETVGKMAPGTHFEEWQNGSSQHN